MFLCALISTLTMTGVLQVPLNLPRSKVNSWGRVCLPKVHTSSPSVSSLPLNFAQLLARLPPLWLFAVYLNFVCRAVPSSSMIVALFLPLMPTQGLSPSPPSSLPLFCTFIASTAPIVGSQSLRRVPLIATPWTVALQAPLSMGFSRQEYWSGLPFPSPRDLPDPGMEPASLALAGRFFTAEPPDNSHYFAIVLPFSSEFPLPLPLPLPLPESSAAAGRSIRGPTLGLLGPGSEAPDTWPFPFSLSSELPLSPNDPGCWV